MLLMIQMLVMVVLIQASKGYKGKPVPLDVFQPQMVLKQAYSYKCWEKTIRGTQFGNHLILLKIEC
jgi:hypothetical protein